MRAAAEMAEAGGVLGGVAAEQALLRRDPLADRSALNGLLAPTSMPLGDFCSLCCCGLSSSRPRNLRTEAGRKDALLNMRLRGGAGRLIYSE